MCKSSTAKKSVQEALTTIRSLLHAFHFHLYDDVVLNVPLVLEDFPNSSPFPYPSAPHAREHA